MGHDVFISYSSGDKLIGDALCNALEAGGVRCWIAPRDIGPGDTWAETIVKAIQRSRIQIVVVSTRSIGSPQVVREVDRAVHYGSFIIPFRVDDAPLSEAMEYLLSTRHWLDALTPPLERHIARIVDTVRAFLRADPADSEPTDSVRAARLGAGLAPERSQGAADRASRIPAPPTALLGRAKELEEIVGVIEKNDARLVVLTGPAGSGKTRLAIEVGQTLCRLPDRFPGGVTFVPLTKVNDPAIVLSSIAHALDLREQPGVPVLETIVDFLREKDALLVVDNFEHVLGAATAVAEVLSRCPRLKVVVTSRTPLRLRGEIEYPVRPLPVMPARAQLTAAAVAHSPAVELFVTRMRARSPDFALNDENASTIVEICARLDGLPLAIELAAARGKLLNPRAMLARLERRFDLLRGGAADVPIHQQTLHGAIAWSVDLLTENERAAFRHLSVFAGGFTLETVESIPEAFGVDGLDMMTAVESLLDNNLLMRHDDDDGASRFSMLISIREFGVEQLSKAGESDEVHRAYVGFFVDFAERALAVMQGAEQGTWLRRLEREHANFRGALAWCNRSDSRMGVQLAGTLARFWWMQGHLTEGRWWLMSLFAAIDPRTVDDRILARAFIGIGTLAWCQSDLDVAHEHFTDALAINRRLGDRAGEAASLNALGLVARSRGDYAASWTLHDDSLTIRRVLGIDAGVASSLNNLGVLAQRHGDLGTARGHHEESLRIRRRIGDRWGMVLCLNDLAALELREDRRDVARVGYAEALDIARDLGDRAGIATALIGLASIARLTGDLSDARALCLDALATSEELGDRFGVSAALWAGAHLAMTMGAADKAAQLAATASVIRRTITAEPPDDERRDVARLVAATEQVLEAGDFRAAWSRGEAMTRQEARDCLAGLSIFRRLD